jgi:hypothetical protein
LGKKVSAAQGFCGRDVSRKGAKAQRKTPWKRGSALEKKVGAAQGSCGRDVSRKGAKAQRKTPRKRGSALRLCAFAGDFLCKGN